MSNNNDLGINSELISSAIVEIQNNIEQVMSVFNTIEALVSDSEDYFEGEMGDAYRNKVSNLSYYFPVVEKNLLTYIEDLTNFRNNYISYESSYRASEVEIIR